MSDEENEAWQGVTGPLKAIGAKSLVGSAMIAKRPTVLYVTPADETRRRNGQYGCKWIVRRVIAAYRYIDAFRTTVFWSQGINLRIHALLYLKIKDGGYRVTLAKVRSQAESKIMTSSSSVSPV
ncbi:hypothetical protein OIDMADRAFT_60947 [Oidiodendron maius Zn]|uniref:Uncharacterized protein n=1 Tax=Oidiodendron maius (strain Zn) TaxID=913774 RepID=A0A0C3CWR3_OIDMZ|nr:hypothetical protein OIDMADRAFT_60947 [Oidiodendron maius Zn]